MSSPNNSVSEALSRTTPVFHLKLWVVIAIVVGIVMGILFIITLWLSVRGKKKTVKGFDTTSLAEIPIMSKEINVDRVDAQSVHDSGPPFMPVHDKYPKMKGAAHLGESRSVDVDAFSQCSSVYNIEKAGSSYSEDYSSSGPARKGSSSYAYSASPLVGLPELSHLGWGHWFTLRDLESATDRFAKSNVLGEGGYGVVYKGRLMNGTEIAVKKILNNVGQAEKEFSVEVEAIGHVRHKNLVRLLGYCVEGIHRMLVYEYVNNGNLEQWLHGNMNQRGVLSWENRMKILLGTAKALAYLHEAIDPKVVHRDIKSSNILINDEFNSKVSDFGLAKLLNSDKSHINTRVMGTYGYVAPEYANSGMLNEKSDIYSFGVVLLESVTARDPVDYSKPADEVNLVEWLKMMVTNKRAEEVVDPNLEVKPPKRALKRAILVGLKCVDPDADKRPKMSHVVQMLEAVQNAYRQDQRKLSLAGSVDIESQQSQEENSNSADA
ncbi:probable receptor-like protein kinase At2g42960 [Phragmites australis]|uniref:probable receptor-like protein kinase At2g42960 n=1 Tax=Phragmites australis TaxID=29695 RepID=UPI002D766390|nr:probable receptor-like protein kinase At2g42960 [Phragmites australis]